MYQERYQGISVSECSGAGLVVVGGAVSGYRETNDAAMGGVKTVQQCTVSPGEGHMFHLFPVCLPWISLQMYKRGLGVI